MKQLRYILLLLFIVLGYFSENLKGEIITLENDKTASFSGQNFHKQKSGAEWLGLLYLQDESTSRNQISLLQFSSGSLFQNFSEELYFKSTASKVKSGYQFSQKSKSHPGNGGYVDAVFHGNPELVDAWEVIKNSGDDNLAKLATDLDELAKVSDNLPSIKKVGSYPEWRKMDDLFKSGRMPDLNTLRKMAQNYLDFTTKSDGAVFWSGPRMVDAQKWAKNNGRSTLEQTVGGKYLDELKLFDNISGQDAAEIWDIASKTFAKNASGTVNVFSTGAKEIGDYGQRTWWRIEKPALLKNSKVIKIVRRNKDGTISKTGHIEVNPK